MWTKEETRGIFSSLKHFFAFWKVIVFFLLSKVCWSFSLSSLEAWQKKQQNKVRFIQISKTFNNSVVETCHNNSCITFLKHISKCRVNYS